MDSWKISSVGGGELGVCACIFDMLQEAEGRYLFVREGMCGVWHEGIWQVEISWVTWKLCEHGKQESTTMKGSAIRVPGYLPGHTQVANNNTVSEFEYLVPPSIFSDTVLSRQVVVAPIFIPDGHL